MLLDIFAWIVVLLVGLFVVTPALGAMFFLPYDMTYLQAMGYGFIVLGFFCLTALTIWSFIRITGGFPNG